MPGKFMNYDYCIHFFNTYLFKKRINKNFNYDNFFLLKILKFKFSHKNNHLLSEANEKLLSNNLEN